jgi:hypothetical protein
MALYDPEQARQELPWAIRQYAPLIANPEREASRGMSEAPIPRSFRVVAISDSHIWAHCTFSEHLASGDPSHTLNRLYIYSFAECAWGDSFHDVYDTIANAAIYRPTNSLFFVTTDNTIHVVAQFAKAPKELTFNIPSQAITAGINTYGIRLFPVSESTCIASDTVNSTWLVSFGQRGTVKRLKVPREACLTSCVVEGNSMLLITYEYAPGQWNTGVVPFPLTEDSPPTTVEAMWIPTPDVFPPLIDGTQIFRFVNSFYFESPSIGKCLALLSPTTVLIHKAIPPYTTVQSFVTACSVADPVDILFRPDIDSLCVITHVGEIVCIPCAEFVPDKADQPSLVAKAICKLPAVSMRYAMNYVPGSVFAYNTPSSTWITFPQNTRLVNQFHESMYPSD